MDISGEIILNSVSAVAVDGDPENRGLMARYLPKPTEETIDPTHLYRIVFLPIVRIAYAINTRTNPESFHLLDVTDRSALQRILAP